MARPKKSPEPLRFEPEAKVRVRHGVRDPDFPDIPLGGWAGTVKEVEQAKGETMYLIVWDRATLRGMHPVYKHRCERDVLELESMWLGDEDLEPDDGTPIPIEPPTAIVTQPLSEKDQDDRVRMALGLTHDDPLPDVSRKTLLAYHRYLRDNLKLPFKARNESDDSSLTVHRLLEPIRRASEGRNDGPGRLQVRPGLRLRRDRGPGRLRVRRPGDRLPWSRLRGRHAQIAGRGDGRPGVGLDLNQAWSRARIV